MLRNESSLDRFARVALGLVLLSLVVIGPRTLWGLVGIVPLFTGFIGFCPLYKVLGLSSSQRKPHTPGHSA